jgi:hypothetical protein
MAIASSFQSWTSAAASLWGHFLQLLSCRFRLPNSSAARLLLDGLRFHESRPMHVPLYSKVVHLCQVWDRLIGLTTSRNAPRVLGQAMFYLGPRHCQWIVTRAFLAHLSVFRAELSS